ncbi:hypothetical protein H0H93_014632 [Arthromyces matolae]|nr:hypothetical protein H0H93_014632 [Arthromyces matolae]
MCPPLPEHVVQAAQELHDKRPYTNMETSPLLGDSLASLIEPFNRTNHSLGSNEVSLLKSDLDQLTPELLELDYDVLSIQLEIDRLVKRLHDIGKTRLAKQKEVDDRQYWLSSVRLLPLDILMQIIYYAASDDLQSKSSPFKLSNVCISWRRAALACPNIWNRITLDLWSPQSSSSGDKLDLTTLLAFWYGHARESSTLSLNASIRTQLEAEAAHDMITAVERWGSRMSHLTLTAYKSQENYDLQSLKSLKPFFEMSPGSFSQLQRLRLVDYTHKYGDKDLPTVTAFDHSPLLLDVVLRLPPALFDPNIRLLLPFSQIRSLTLGGDISLRGWVNVLLECRNLVSAVFYRVNLLLDEIVFPLPNTPITFPDLEAFHVNFMDGGLWNPREFNEFLSNIHLPALQNLNFQGNWNRYASHRIPVTSLSTFSIGDYPPLRRLTLANVDIRANDLVVILNASPLLEKLALYLRLPPKFVLESLTLRTTSNNADGAWAKNLEVFMLGFHTPSVEHNSDLDDVAAAFSNFLISWVSISDVPQELLLRSCLVLYDDSTRYESRKKLNATHERVRDLVNAVLEREVFSKGMNPKFSVDIVERYGNMFKYFGMADTTLQDLSLEDED